MQMKDWYKWEAAVRDLTIGSSDDYVVKCGHLLLDGSITLISHSVPNLSLGLVYYLEMTRRVYPTCFVLSEDWLLWWFTRAIGSSLDYRLSGESTTRPIPSVVHCVLFRTIFHLDWCIVWLARWVYPTCFVQRTAYSDDSFAVGSSHDYGWSGQSTISRLIHLLLARLYSVPNHLLLGLVYFLKDAESLPHMFHPWRTCILWWIHPRLVHHTITV